MNEVPLEDMGPLVNINSRNRGPAILFDHIQGHEGFRILSCMISNSARLALSFGLDASTSTHELIQWLRGKPEKWLRESKSYDPVYVEDGPIFENIKTGSDVDIGIFPVPEKFEPGDGGPFIGTGASVITKDPESNWINVGSYRSQVYSKNEVGLQMSSGKHGKLILNRYVKKGESMPVVCVWGIHDPVLFLASGTEVPTGVSEMNFVGAMRGQSMEVVKGKATGLPIPANAEIAVEGFVNPGDIRDEGPLAEWAGYYLRGGKDTPFFKITNLYYRNSPILTMEPPNKSSYDPVRYWRSVYRSALIRDRLESMGVPGIKAIWVPEFGGTRMFVVISIKQEHGGHATEAAVLASQIREGAYCNKYVVVVDEDVDVYDLEDVMWAVVTRTRPDQDIDILRKTWSSPADPRVRLPTTDFTDSVAVIRATIPFEWKEEFPKTSLPEEPIRNRIFEKYGKMLGWKSATAFQS